jgi:hypothetical protein
VERALQLVLPALHLLLHRSLMVIHLAFSLICRCSGSSSITMLAASFSMLPLQLFSAAIN